MKKIGLFGGTFDPIHNGHLHLALQILEKRGLDEVLFVPAQVSPLKQQNPPHARGKDRLECVRLSIEPIASFRLIPWEIEAPGPSYAIDTVRRLYAEAKEKVQLHLILGEDLLAELPLWKEVSELLNLAPPLIGSRLSESSQPFPSGWTKIPIMEISSTLIRERLKAKLFCAHLVPSQVLDYIYSHSLY